MTRKAVALISTLHDPQGTSFEFVKKYLDQITRLFDFVTLAVTQNTSKKIINFLIKNKISIKLQPTGFGSLARRTALRSALKTKADLFLQIDFDRLLFWLEKYPQELLKILNKIKKIDEDEYFVLGRTKKAWLTHPIYQQQPEERTNQAISREIEKLVDVTAGCCAFPRKIGQIIDKKVKGKLPGVSDIEWLMIGRFFGDAKIKSILVNGLAYETLLIFGPERAKKVDGLYNITRNQIADETIKMIEKWRNKGSFGLFG